jgi:predicted nuclease of predicted toxin-antitoxin system
VKLYLDQMLRVDLAALLRAEGHDVLRAEEAGQSRTDDAEILDRARSQGRILITLDEHFGNWAVLPLSTHPGVLRIKVALTTTKNVVGLLLPFLTKHVQGDFINHLVILSEKSVRWVKTG